MKQLFESEYDNFLAQSAKFYKRIDRYVPVLNLDASEVTSFKGDMELMFFILERYKSFAESFIKYNLHLMRKRLSGLAVKCLASDNYNRKIGEELGIENAMPDNSDESGFGLIPGVTFI